MELNALANNRDDSVDDILQEMKQKEDVLKNTSTLSVDEILAEMGLREAMPYKAASAPPPAKPAAAKTPPPRPVAPKAPPVVQPPPQPEYIPEPVLEEPEEEPEEPLPRAPMGKAAALDLVDPDKFSGETELLSWFEQDGGAPMSKKEQKQAEKMRKKREAALRKEEKQHRKNGYEEPDETEEEWESEEEAAWGEETGQFGQPEGEADDGEPWFEEQTESGVTDDYATYAAPVENTYTSEPEQYFTRQPDAGYMPDAPETSYFDEAAGPAFTHGYGAEPFAGVQSDDSADAADAYAYVQEESQQPAYAQTDEAFAQPAYGQEPAYFEQHEEQPQSGYMDFAADGQGDTQPFKLFETQELDISAVGAAAGYGALEQEAPVGGYDDPWEQQEEWPEEGSLFDASHAQRTTQVFTPQPDAAYPKVPPADFTQEFGEVEEDDEGNPKTLYVDDMVDDRFREFFSETVSVDREDEERNDKKDRRRLSRSQLLTGEFSKLGTQAGFELDLEEEAYQDGDEEGGGKEYRHPKDAPVIQKSIFKPQRSLLVRFIINAVLAALLFWLGAVGAVPLPGIVSPALHPVSFGAVYMALALALVVVNFSTVAPGIVGLFGEPTVDTGPALSAVAVLLQAVVVFVQMVTASTLNGTLFGGLAGLLLAANAFGKYIRARSILNSFELASSGVDHSAAYAGYVLDYNNEIALDITQGLNEDYPAVLVSRPTALVKGFMRQSFSPRWSDGVGRIVGWILFGVALLCGIFTYVQSKQLMPAVTAFAAALCLGTPLTSSLVSGLSSMLLQRSTARVGAVVPGWSAVEELGQVNVVMATASDIFPPSSIALHGLRAFELQNINNAILYAASVIVEGCDSLRDIFLALINGKTETLYKVESLIYEPGKGYTAWVDDKRIVLGTREMLQKHDIEPPSVETEMQYINSPGRRPIYLAVSGKLYGMFVAGYISDAGVQGMLEGLVQSGVSLLVTSDDMNVTSGLIEEIYDLPKGIAKVLGQRELEMLEPLTGYLDESEGVMTHIGSFTSFIGGMRAAASCAVAERMGSILQVVSAGFGCFLCFVLAMFEGLANISIFPVLLFQVAWALVAVVIPFARQH